MRGPGRRARCTAFGPLLGTGETPLLGELPGDSWVALGAPNVGPALKTHLHAAWRARSAAPPRRSSSQQQFGLDLERDVFGWIGDIAIFARGSDKAEPRGRRS